MRWERISEKYAYYPSTKMPYASLDIPAWSLHRLIEMALRYVLICGISFTFNEDAYEKVIGIIEHQIKEGYFPKEYLVDLTGTDSHQDMVDAFGYAFEAMKAKKEE